MGSGSPLPIIYGSQNGTTIARRFLSRYAPLVLWLAFISFASSDGFSANNTSRVIEPIVLWLFPHTSQAHLELIHFLTGNSPILVSTHCLRFWQPALSVHLRTLTLKRRWFFVSLAIIVLYALLDEYHQSFVPSRTASVFDSFIDMSGGVTALVVIWLRTRKDDASN
jgi:VanZ family protein